MGLILIIKDKCLQKYNILISNANSSKYYLIAFFHELLSIQVFRFCLFFEFQNILCRLFPINCLDAFEFIINNCKSMNIGAYEHTNIDMNETGNANGGLRAVGQPMPEQNKGKQEQNLAKNQLNQRCRFFQSRRNKIIAIVFICLIVVAAIVTPLIIIFGRVQQSKDVDTFMIDYKNKSLAVSSTTVNLGIDYVNLQMTGNKVEAIHPYSQITTRQLKSDDETKRIYDISMPFFMLFQIVGESVQQWLDIYNKDSRSFINSFLKTLKQIDFKKSEDPSESSFKITELSEITFFDIRYNPEKQEFELLKLEEEKIEEPITRQPEKVIVQNEQNWLMSLFNLGVKKVKETIATNFEIIKNNSASIKKQQEFFAEQKDLLSDWAQALINQCRTLNLLEFRCTFEGLKVLVPSLQAEEISKIPENAIVNYGLKFKLEQTIA